MPSIETEGPAVRPLYSYVIRLYRRDAEALAGVIEDVQTNRAAPFRSLAELGEMLTGRQRLPRRAPRAAGDKS